MWVSCVAVKWKQQRRGQLQVGTTQAGRDCDCTAPKYHDGATASDACHHVYPSEHASTLPEGRPHAGVWRVRQSSANTFTSVREQSARNYTSEQAPGELLLNCLCREKHGVSEHRDFVRSRSPEHKVWP